jgi:hypothetical protein
LSWASRPVESTHSGESRPSIGGRIGNEPGGDDRALEGDVLAALDRDRVRVLEAAGALHPLDAVRLEQGRDPAGHLLDDGGLPLVRGRQVELRFADLDSELGKALLGLLQREGGLHPGLRRDAADAQARAAELGLLLDTDRAHAELGCADRGRVAAWAASEDCNIAFHASILAGRVMIER